MSKVTFNNKSTIFYTALKSEVDKYFQQKHLKRTGNWKLFLKTGVLIPVAILLYVFIIFFHLPIALLIVMAGLLGFVFASIGFNVMHDACHGSYSSHKWANNVVGLLTMNALGGNAYIWKQKHNIIHHTYTNVDGMDDDIAKSPLIRQCDTQKWVPMHRIQHIYLPLIYSITSLAWTFLTDFLKYFSQKVHKTGMKKMDTKEHIIFWTSKVLYVGSYILVPLFIKGAIVWLLFFATMHVVLGITLAIVFQLAHVVENTEFEVVAADAKVIESEWAVHQIKTTANFANNNKIISWFVGGLNFQIEHHLFPKVSHIHYPALSKIVKRVCEMHGLPYNQYPTMWSAVVSHFRFMRQLGRKPKLA